MSVFVISCMNKRVLSILGYWFSVKVSFSIVSIGMVSWLFFCLNWLCKQLISNVEYQLWVGRSNEVRRNAETLTLSIKERLVHGDEKECYFGFISLFFLVLRYQFKYT